MPGPDAAGAAALVKCEPASDDDSDSQFSHSFLYNQLPLLERPVKSEISHDDSHASHLLHNLQNADGLEELAPLAPAGPAATPVVVKQEPGSITPSTTLETLESTTHTNFMSSALLEKGIGLLRSRDLIESEFLPLLAVKDEPLSEGEQLQLSGEDTSDSSSTLPEPSARSSPKSWTAQDMENALEALRKHNMSLTKASAKFGIPSTTLWQRAHRLGIDTPKKEGANKSWSQADLHGALHALRAGAISANKASKAYGIPSSTLYKIARREGIRLAAPFNAAPTAWRRADLDRALASIRCGATSVQRAASQFGIPTGTLYGRCKREGIELSRSNPTPWSEDAMGEALEAVRVGQMSINQAAIHYNLPYSSLYGRFKRCKYQTQMPQSQPQNLQETYETDHHQSQEMSYYHQTEAQGPPNESHVGYVHQVVPESHTSPVDYGHNIYYGCNSVVLS